LHVHQLSRQLAAADDQLRERVSGLAAPVKLAGEFDDFCLTIFNSGGYWV
jgi:hypothetical protein